MKSPIGNLPMFYRFQPQNDYWSIASYYTYFEKKSAHKFWAKLGNASHSVRCNAVTSWTVIATQQFFSKVTSFLQSKDQNHCISDLGLAICAEKNHVHLCQKGFYLLKKKVICLNGMLFKIVYIIFS